jgi:hypothetical protein
MSDWIDLQLAHSLGPVKAPDQLWARIEDAASVPVRRRSMIRWALPAAIAACIMLLFSRPAHNAGPELAYTDPEAVGRWLGHESGVQVRLRPAPAVCIKIERPAKKASGVVMPARENSLIVRPVRPLTLTAAKLDGACRSCHTL